MSLHEVHVETSDINFIGLSAKGTWLQLDSQELTPLPPCPMQSGSNSWPMTI